MVWVGWSVAFGREKFKKNQEKRQGRAGKRGVLLLAGLRCFLGICQRIQTQRRENEERFQREPRESSKGSEGWLGCVERGLLGQYARCARRCRELRAGQLLSSARQDKVDGAVVILIEALDGA